MSNLPPRTAARQAALGLLLMLFAAQLWAVRRESPTVDEQAHLARGLSYLRTGDLRLYVGHPPLVNMWAALPLALDPAVRLPLDDASWRNPDWIAFPTKFMYSSGNDPQKMLAAARTMIVLLTLVLGAVVYRFGADVGGPLVGLTALALLSLDPNLRAHGRLVTTDAGVTLFLTASLWLWRRVTVRPLWRTALAAGVVLGLALVSKFTAMLYLPALLGLAGLIPGGLRRRWPLVAAALIGAGLTAWGLYRFEVRWLAGFPFPVPLASYWEEFMWTMKELAGTPTYLLGQVSRSGFYAYFPVAVLVKTPLPLLLLIVYGAVQPLRGRRWNTLAFLWLPAGLYFLVAVVTRVNIGFRHLLPVLPAFYLSGGLALSAVWCRARWGRWAAGLLGLWLIWNNLWVYPRDLTFFNEIAGGPDNGRRWLVDSNLDWGQDMGELMAYVRTHNLDPLYVSYFGPTVPKNIGLSARPLPPSPNPDWRPEFPAPGWYAISVTHLLGGAVVENPDVFSYFQHRAPDVIIGRTIYLYHVLPTRGAVAVCFNPPPGFGVDEARALFGLAVTRVLDFDCASGVVLPAERTWYVLRGAQPETVQPALTRLGAQVVYDEPHRADRSRAVTIFLLEAPAARAEAYPEHPVRPQSFGGLADFIGYGYRAPLRPGQPTQVQTVWRIEAPLTEPVSIFLHLTAPDGFPLEVSDGLNTSFDQLQPGDNVIQFHPLVYPAELPPSSRWQVGLYALTGAQARYLLPDGRDAYSFAP